MYEITPNLDPNDNTPLYIQLYNYLLTEIEAGRIPQGTRLPSIRALASHLGIGKNTVDAAYQQLIAEGYIKSKPKSGLYVTEFDDQLLVPPPHTPNALNSEEIYRPVEDIFHLIFGMVRLIKIASLLPFGKRLPIKYCMKRIFSPMVTGKVNLNFV